MKSMFLKGVVRGLIVIGAAMALVNCDEQATVANAEGDPAYVDPLSDLPVDPALDTAQGIEDPQNPNGGLNQGDGENLLPDNGATLPGNNPVNDSTVTDPTGNPLVDTTGHVANSSADIALPTSSSSENVTVSSSSKERQGRSSSSEEQKVESSSSEAVVDDGIFLATDTDENVDYMEVEYIKDTGWDGGGILAYPKRLSETKKHGVVMWGPGGSTNPDAYGGMIRRLASHGFVVIALKESPGNTTQGKPALDWLENKNKTPGDPLYGKLDMTKVGCSGHSMGGLESEQMVINDSRVITAMLNNSGDLGHTAMASVPANKTIGIVYGEGGMERPNSEADYNNPNVKAPACLIRMTGGQGNECQMGEYGQLECGWGHGSGSWGGMTATIAWMRWHLGGEEWRKADFVGTSGKYINGPIVGEQGYWKGTCKNF